MRQGCVGFRLLSMCLSPLVKDGPEMFRISLVIGFWAVHWSSALCPVAACASAATTLFFICVTSGLVLQTAKWMVARSCASCFVVILLSLGLLQVHGLAVLLVKFCSTVILSHARFVFRFRFLVQWCGSVHNCFNSLPLLQLLG